MTDVTFEETLPCPNGDVTSANVIAIIQAYEFKMSGLSLKDIQIEGDGEFEIDSETFLYSKAPDIFLTLSNSEMSCNKEYSSDIETVTHSSLFYIISAYSFISYANEISNCNYGSYGVYYLVNVFDI